MADTQAVTGRIHASDLLDAVRRSWTRSCDALAAREATVPERALDLDVVHGELLRELATATQRLRAARDLFERMHCPGTSASESHRLGGELESLAAGACARSAAREIAWAEAGLAEARDSAAFTLTARRTG